MIDVCVEGRCDETDIHIQRDENKIRRKKMGKNVNYPNKDRKMTKKLYL